jgi:hypothetical protein
MAQIIRSKNRKGRAAQIVVYDLQGTQLPKEFLEKLEGAISTFLDQDSLGGKVAVTVNVE